MCVSSQRAAVRPSLHINCELQDGRSRLCEFGLKREIPKRDVHCSSCHLLNSAHINVQTEESRQRSVKPKKVLT